ncbi:hypothetical protein JSY36_19465 [Bacillus sp. H-16]|uniref:DUF5696 domain-containing protein n=1 Tax=Alteribacter salitolerans TaxID=2912333 RepID=UPI0019660F3E|nr:hypothetical protein [Alteribacter salitolerans]
MYKKWLVFLLVMILPVPVIATALSDDEADPDTELTEIQAELAEQSFKYRSNQFTQPEAGEGESAEVDTSADGFDQVAENENLSLFVNEESLALKIMDNRTGYMWNSGLDSNKEYNLNDTWMNMAQSAITIDYLDQNENSSTTNILSDEASIDIQSQEDGFTAEVDFSEIGISLELSVRLGEDSIDVHIPESGITESETGRLVSLRLYPFLGAVEGNDIDGYMFIPDGSGALVRFNEGNRGARSSYQASIYGEDEGFKRTYEDTETETNPVQNVTLPVYGIVHEANQNAIFTIIEEGKYNSDIIAYPSGVSTDFNWMTTQYNYRYQYYQPTSQAMSGYNTYQEEKNTFDIHEKTVFLIEEEADYVGMANYYQDFLADKGDLSIADQQADIRLEFLGGEVKRGLLWDSVVPMTEVSELPGMIESLNQQSVDNMQVVLRGWSKGGLTGSLPRKFPFESKVGSGSDFEETIQHFQDQGLPLYFHTDYTKAYDGASGYGGRSDVARKVNAETMGGSTFDRDFYFLSPAVSREHAQQDAADFADHQISHLAVGTSAGTLFSDFNTNRTMNREGMAVEYDDIFGELGSNLDSLSFYQPNDYMWSHMDRYLDVPMYSSNYSFVTDTVPFIQIVLRGYIPYYAPYSNFFYNQDEEVLRMIEYGAYPSFYLTKEPSHLLRDTPSRDLYTSEFSVWESEIVRQYELVQESLGRVEGETIVSRDVHDYGVVEVTYSNGISILVNYTSEAYTVDGHEVEATAFKVLDRGE